MNKEYILSRVKPYLNSQGMLGEEDYDKLFARLPKHHQYKVIDILIEANIEIDYDNVSLDSEKDQLRTEAKGMYAGKLNKLTNEQLCVIYQQGNDQALEALISKNIKLVHSRVNKYRNAYKHKLDEEDLVQYGIMGLMKAADRFESAKDAKFITYATWWVDQVIYRGIQDYGFTIRIPAHCFDDVNKVKRIFREHPNYSKHQVYEIVKENGMSRDKFEEILRIAENIISLSSLNSIVGEEESSELGEFVVDETIETVEEIVESKALKEAIKNVLDTMTARENKILRLRFGLDDGRRRTLEEVGKAFKVTRERIRQIEAKALRKLRHPSRSKKLKDFI